MELREAGDYAALHPGRFRDGRSAKLLADAGRQATSFPTAVRRLLANDEFYLTVRPKFAIAEQVVFLDTFAATSETDLMLYCEDRERRRVVIAVEVKVDEPFAARVSRWRRSSDGLGSFL